MVNSREEILQLLGDLQAHYAAYHKHKETTAWVAFAVCVTLIPRLHSAIARVTDSSSWTLFLYAVGATLIGAIALIYVCVQLKLRRDGARYVSACMSLRSEYVSRPDESIDVRRFAPEPDASGPTDSSRALPMAVKAKAKGTKDPRWSLRRILEYCVLAAMLLLTMGVILEAWIKFMR